MNRSIHSARLIHGDGSMVVTERPARMNGATVADVDAHFQRARELGARVLSTPSDYPYSERQYIVEDVGGHRWIFSQTLHDVHPEQWRGQLRAG